MSTLPRQSGATPRFHVSLSTRSVFAVPDGAGVGIECRSGSVWVTVDRDARDIVLAPGERFQSAEHREMLRQGVRELRNREHEDQIEEQFDEGDLALVLAALGAKPVFPTPKDHACAPLSVAGDCASAAFRLGRG